MLVNHHWIPPEEEDTTGRDFKVHDGDKTKAETNSNVVKRSNKFKHFDYEQFDKT